MNSRRRSNSRDRSFETAKKGNGWLKWGAVAASLCIVILGAVIWRKATPSRNETPGITVSEDGVTIPRMEVSLSANEEASMIDVVQKKWTLSAQRKEGIIQKKEGVRNGKNTTKL